MSAKGTHYPEEAKKEEEVEEEEGRSGAEGSGERLAERSGERTHWGDQTTQALSHDWEGGRLLGAAAGLLLGWRGWWRDAAGDAGDAVLPRENKESPVTVAS